MNKKIRYECYQHTHIMEGGSKGDEVELIKVVRNSKQADAFVQEYLDGKVHYKRFWRRVIKGQL